MDVDYKSLQLSEKHSSYKPCSKTIIKHIDELRNCIVDNIMKKLTIIIFSCIEVGRKILEKYVPVEQTEEYCLKLFFGLSESKNKWIDTIRNKVVENCNKLLFVDLSYYTPEEKKQYVEEVVIDTLQQAYINSPIVLETLKKFSDNQEENLKIVRFLACILIISDLKTIIENTEIIDETDISNLKILGLSFTDNECVKIKNFLLHEHIYITNDGIKIMKKQLDKTTDKGVQYFLSRLTL